MSNDSMLTLLTEDREMLSESLQNSRPSVVLTDLIYLMSNAYDLARIVLEIEYQVRNGGDMSEIDIDTAVSLSAEVKSFVDDTLKNGF